MSYRQYLWVVGPSEKRTLDSTCLWVVGLPKRGHWILHGLSIMALTKSGIVHAQDGRRASLEDRSSHHS